MNTQFWKTRYTWSPLPDDPIPGYTLLLPVPGDLPVFLKMALDVCSRQDLEHLADALVVPDHTTPQFEDRVADWTGSCAIRSLRLVKLQPQDRLFVEKLNHPHLNYWLQLTRGVMATRTTHAVLHDADLVMTNPSFLKTHYESCLGRQLACLGVSPVWDPWFRQRGINHVVATWEMIFELSWWRSFEPWQHMGHDDTLNGEQHEFDITLWPQCKTAPERIGLRSEEKGFIHFNYVISAYRWFQQSTSSVEDQYFRLLLIRLLIDAYDAAGWRYELPELGDMIRGLTDPTNRVTYTDAATPQHYAPFRSKIRRLLESGLLDAHAVSVIKDGLAPFDRAFK